MAKLKKAQAKNKKTPAKNKNQEKKPCPVCGGFHGERQDLGIACSQEDLDNIQLINNKINCAAQSARPDAIPDGISAEKAKLFAQAMLDALQNYRWLETDWWRTAIKKYNLPKDKNVYIDFTNGAFYVLEG